MSDWFKFSLLDMTPYDQEGWLWLIASYQQEYPFIPLLSLIGSILLIVLLLRKTPAPRFALVLLACSWLWCGAIFQMQYHASLNWAAPTIGWVFIIQAGLLLLLALFAKHLAWEDLKQRDAWPGLLLVLLALLYPLTGLSEGREWQQLEWVFLMPPPTTLLTLGIGLLLAGRWRLILLPIPIGWALVSAAFTLKLGLLEPYITAAALLALLYSVKQIWRCIGLGSRP